MSYELPPQARGGAEEQLAALRDYLVRLAQELERAERSESAETAVSARSAREQNEKALREQASSLKALIVKSADEIAERTDARFDSLASSYVAISDYGSYYGRIDTQVRQTARETVESYRFSEAVEALERHMSELNGQIRRGLIEDPLTHEIHLGIAVSESLSFTGQTQNVGGATYYELTPGQTLGLYTASGWQFWINGVRRGWFSSQDSMLHVSNIVVEDKLRVGADWEISSSGGFGLRYTGG
ncbi:MAG: hypothetical protein IJQ43_05055 [Oscillospiraceae bacterium]|nr:hypothetical protein [Oscillospiraceae bacterium]